MTYDHQYWKAFGFGNPIENSRSVPIIVGITPLLIVLTGEWAGPWTG